MIGVAYAVLAVAALLFMGRLFVGPSVADRIIALDGVLVTVMCGVLVGAADSSSTIGIETILVVALLGFIGTAIVARYIEGRGE